MYTVGELWPRTPARGQLKLMYKNGCKCIKISIMNKKWVQNDSRQLEVDGFTNRLSIKRLGLRTLVGHTTCFASGTYPHWT